MPSERPSLGAAPRPRWWSKRSSAARSSSPPARGTRGASPRAGAWGACLKVLPVPERQETFGVIELDSAGAPADAPTARLVAALLLGAWRVAFREALRRQRSARA